MVITISDQESGCTKLKGCRHGSQNDQPKTGSALGLRLSSLSLAVTLHFKLYTENQMKGIIGCVLLPWAAFVAQHYFGLGLEQPFHFLYSLLCWALNKPVLKFCGPSCGYWNAFTVVSDWVDNQPQGVSKRPKKWFCLGSFASPAFLSG